MTLSIEVSAFLTITMTSMEDGIEAVEEANLDCKIKIMIGGVSVTQGYADEIGADGYPSDAASAIDEAKKAFRTGMLIEIPKQGISKRGVCKMREQCNSLKGRGGSTNLLLLVKLRKFTMLLYESQRKRG